ncbi:unnamed protein product [Amoebophrya sp. A25]|nr:unnamed protein product [Amoebophrya sp. A25]|eukprot:GSA25T00013284001.1
MFSSWDGQFVAFTHNDDSRWVPGLCAREETSRLLHHASFAKILERDVGTHGIMNPKDADAGKKIMNPKDADAGKKIIRGKFQDKLQETLASWLPTAAELASSDDEQQVQSLEDWRAPEFGSELQAMARRLGVRPGAGLSDDYSLETPTQSPPAPVRCSKSRNRGADTPSRPVLADGLEGTAVAASEGIFPEAGESEENEDDASDGALSGTEAMGSKAKSSKTSTIGIDPVLIVEEVWSPSPSKSNVDNISSTGGGSLAAKGEPTPMIDARATSTSSNALETTTTPKGLNLQPSTFNIKQSQATPKQSPQQSPQSTSAAPASRSSTLQAAAAGPSSSGGGKTTQQQQASSPASQSEVDPNASLDVKAAKQAKQNAKAEQAQQLTIADAKRSEEAAMKASNDQYLEDCMVGFMKVGAAGVKSSKDEQPEKKKVYSGEIERAKLRLEQKLRKKRLLGQW